MRVMVSSVGAALFLFGCAHQSQSTILSSEPDRLAQWTRALRDSQPDDAYAAVYAARSKNLVFVAAMHSTETSSLTFRIIEDAYAAFDFDTAIVEGFPASGGPNADELIKYARQSKAVDGFQEGGETVPTVKGALEEGTNILGGEPDDADIRDELLSEGFGPEDILGFYTLRTIPQWIRERKIDGPADSRIAALIDDELDANRQRLGFSAEVLPTGADWIGWYAETNDKPFGEAFQPEEAGPLADGPYGSNKIAAAISHARAAFLHRLVIGRLNSGDSVLVVFGASHYLIHRPALAHLLGEPCYLGAAMSEAPGACNSN